jgi:hypothetical protein
VPVKIVAELQGKQEAVDESTIVETLERNRDRVRSLVTMMISTTSILFSANLAILIFTIDKIRTAGLLSRLLCVMSLVCLLATLVTSMTGAFLRRRYSIVTTAKFIDDLLTIYYSELRIIRIAFVFLVAGLTSLLGVVISIVFQH